MIEIHRFLLGRCLSLLLPVAALLVHAPLSAGEPRTGVVTRCGWFSNPTPANAWLLDREAEWTIGVQGGPQADGDWPVFARSQWVSTNGSYGYGCACMGVVADPATHEVSVIRWARAQSLAVCRKDRSLKAPS